jgi:hypothetical protein
MPRDLSLMAHGSLKPGEGREDLERGPLRVLRAAKVGRHPVLLLRPEGYPTGGIHGGRLAVVWNQQDKGYALSMHFAEGTAYDASARETVLLEIATSMSRFHAAAARGLNRRRPSGSAGSKE